VDIVQLHKDLMEKQAAYRTVADKYESLNVTLTSLRTQVRGRREKWISLRSEGAKRMSVSFTTYMRRKGHLGVIHFRSGTGAGLDQEGVSDPTVGDMVVQVAPDLHSRTDTKIEDLTQNVEETQTSGGGRGSGYADLGSLSGGEKSYAMVSLLSALWDAVDVPFVMLDEFDVFMDEATRRSAMVALLRNAKDFKGMRQFIFITPHDISSAVKGSDDFVKVFKLRAVQPLQLDDE
jgi:chromosome segregation ATPase